MHKIPKTAIVGALRLAGRCLQLCAQVHFINKLAISFLLYVLSLESNTRTEEGKPPNSGLRCNITNSLFSVTIVFLLKNVT